MSEESHAKQRESLVRVVEGQTVKRMRARKNPPGQIIPWDKDPVILERMAFIAKMWAEGRTEAFMLERTNAWCREHGYPEISVRTLHRDKERIVTRPKMEIEKIRQEQINALEHLKSVAYDRMDQEDVGSNAAAQFASVIERAEADKAKITGAMVHRIEKQVTITEDETARVLVTVLARKLGEEVAFALLEEVKREIDAKQNPRLVDAKVIDASAVEVDES